MQIWVGLGNPGAQYSLHRHNVGFMATDVIAEARAFGPWQKKFRSLVSEWAKLSVKGMAQLKALSPIAP